MRGDGDQISAVAVVTLVWPLKAETANGAVDKMLYRNNIEELNADDFFGNIF